MSTRPSDLRFQLSSRFTFKIFPLHIDSAQLPPHKLQTDQAGLCHVELVVQKLERGLCLTQNRQVSGPQSEFKAFVSGHTS